jgi:hypothetical protein
VLAAPRAIFKTMAEESALEHPAEIYSPFDAGEIECLAICPGQSLGLGSETAALFCGRGRFCEWRSV